MEIERPNKIKTKAYLHFLIKLSLFFLLLIVLDFGIGKTLNFFYFHQQSGFQNRITYSIEKTQEDIIIIGSSRAKHHYIPDTIAKKLSQTCYNAGNNGQHIFYYYAILKSILKRYSPKIIILDLKQREFCVNSESYERLSILLPYYRSHEEIRSIIELKSSYEKYKLLSHIYPYNSSLFTIAAGNMEFNKKRKTDDNGFIPLIHTMTEPINKDSTFAPYKFDSLKINAYQSFIKDCIKAKIKLYIVCSPYLAKSINTEPSIKTGKEIAKKYNIEFIDYSNDTLYTHHLNLFANPTHLNNLGASLFSSKIACKIVELNK